MGKTKSYADEERIDTFISEHRIIVEDPEAGEASLRRVVIAASEVYQYFSTEQIEAASRHTEAANELAAAVENPGTPASAVLVLEKRYAREKAEHERVKALGERLLAFFDEANVRYEAAAGNDGAVQAFEGEPESPRSGFFRRLFGA